MNTMVYGNLALTPNAGRPELQVISGVASCFVVAPQRQFAAPDVYASRGYRASSRSSIIRAALGIFALVAFSCALVMGVNFMRDVARVSTLEQVEQTFVAVKSGESLWEIAQRHGIEGLATSETVDAIRTWNNLDSAMLRAGMELVVPA